MTKGRGGRVLATVLFTDIVDSSRLARELGDRRWRVLLDRHHVVVRRALKRWHGREVDNAGDGFLAAFDDQADAIRCACEISDRVHELGIEVRAGCHVGQAEVIGHKLSGVTVHVGARVMSLAGPSEVLVSGVMKDLVPGSGFAFDDRGSHELKGIEGSWQLWEVTAVDGLPRSAPLDPDEAAERLSSISPLPVHQRRWGRVLIAGVAACAVVASAVYWVQRPQPLEIRPESLLRIDPQTNEISAAVPARKPGAGQLVAVPPSEVWVLSQPEQVISIVDADTAEVSDTVPVQSGQTTSTETGYGLTFGSDLVWVVPREPGDTIEALDPSNHDRERTVRVSGAAGGIGRMAFGGGYLWVPVTGRGGDIPWELVGVDPGNGDEIVRARTGLGGYNVAFGEGAAWVTNNGESSLTRIDPATGDVSTIDLAGVGQPSGVVACFGSVWVSDALMGVVYRVNPDTGEVIDTIEVGEVGTGNQSDVAGLAGSVWVTDPNRKSIVRIDPDTDAITARIRLPFAPQDLVVGFGSVWVTVVEFPR